MRLEEIKEMLKKTGLPVAYRAFRRRQEPPFLCYLTAGSNNFAADGTVYFKIMRVQVELYTKEKNLEAEERVENALSSVFWDKTETFIESEGIYQILYEFEV